MKFSVRNSLKFVYTENDVPFAKLNLRRDLALGGQTHSHVSSQVHAILQKTFQDRPSSISLANTRLMEKLALTWIGWPNAEKIALNFAQI